MNFDEFNNDKKTLNAVIRSLEVIGEAVKNTPDSVKTKYPLISWKIMSGMRDKLIHGYFGIDNEILWKTIKTNIPPLKPLFKEIKDNLG